MKGETWVIFGCGLVGLWSYSFGALQAVTMAAVESDLNDSQLDVYTDRFIEQNSALTRVAW